MLPGKTLWLVNNIEGDHEICLRFQTTEEVYEIILISHGRHLLVSQMQKALELIGKLLHCWDEHVSYSTLTV